jgi:hypothetical protein
MADKLKHPQGGVTTRDDATDLGVEMTAGDPSEPVGPEDALGVGKKRGEYADRIGPSSYHPHEAVPVQEVKPGEPVVELQSQRERVGQRGDEKGRKGGTETPRA